MFGLKEHIYLEGKDRNEMGKFLRSFFPLLFITKKRKVIGKFDDEEVDMGTAYNVLCSDKMAKVIDRYFGFGLNGIIENAGKINDEPFDCRLGEKK